MALTIYSNMNRLPADLGDHVFVFTGRAYDENGEPEGISTVASCSYRVGGQTVSFRRNMDSAAQRFEYTLKWAVKCAATFGIDDIHAVFELKRPINAEFLEKIYPGGVIDLRRREPTPCETNAAASMERLRGQAGIMPPRRRLIFRNRSNTIKPNRAYINA